jgi:mono/diheme cytochrome c family protein
MSRWLLLVLASSCAAEPVVQPAGKLWLSETGLYADIASKRVAEQLMPFKPAFALWTDAAEKQRWLYLPDGQRIDRSDMDHWRFPIGTVAFKEFSRDGKRLETRVIARLSEAEYFMGAFAWNEDESDARYVPDGMQNVRGTDHDVPSAGQCGTCHNGEPGKLLGFSAVQQADVFAPPGDAVTANALGYLHANCAHCHNPNGSARPDTDMNLRLSVRDTEPSATAAYRTVVGKRAELLIDRMRSREPRTQMPPLGTEHVDARGVAAVQAWLARSPVINRGAK